MQPFARRLLRLCWCLYFKKVDYAGGWTKNWKQNKLLLWRKQSISWFRFFWGKYYTFYWLLLYSSRWWGCSPRVVQFLGNSKTYKTSLFPGPLWLEEVTPHSAQATDQVMKGQIQLFFRMSSDPQAIPTSRSNQQTPSGPVDTKSSRAFGGRRASQW